MAHAQREGKRERKKYLLILLPSIQWNGGTESVYEDKINQRWLIDEEDGEDQKKKQSRMRNSK